MGGFLARVDARDLSETREGGEVSSGPAADVEDLPPPAGGRWRQPLSQSVDEDLAASVVRRLPRLRPAQVGQGEQQRGSHEREGPGSDGIAEGRRRHQDEAERTEVEQRREHAGVKEQHPDVVPQRGVRRVERHDRLVKRPQQAVE